MIRSANANDIVNINKLGLQFNSNFVSTYNISEYLKNDNYIILVNNEEQINGFMIVYKNIDDYELEAICVNLKDRKKNIASKMLDYFISNYLTKNDSIILEVATNNMAALKLYEKFKFKTINIRKKYYNNTTDAYIMKKVI